MTFFVREAEPLETCGNCKMMNADTLCRSQGVTQFKECDVLILLYHFKQEANMRGKLASSGGTPHRSDCCNSGAPNLPGPSTASGR